jgi:hypothetical protein
LIGRALDQLRERAERQADRGGERDVPNTAAEEHDERAGGDRVREHREEALEVRRAGDDRFELPHALLGCDLAGDNIVGESVDRRELAHVELATLDAHQPGLELDRLAEAHDDGGRGGEHLGLDAKLAADAKQGLLEAMGRRAVAVEGPAERHDEADGGVVHALHDTPT